MRKYYLYIIIKKININFKNLKAAYLNVYHVMMAFHVFLVQRVLIEMENSVNAKMVLLMLMVNALVIKLKKEIISFINLSFLN